MNRQITVTRTIEIAAPPDVVFDFTQDYARRRTWDAAIVDAEVLATDPAPRVRIAAKGGLVCVFQYKQFDRPRSTSLAMTDVRSPLVQGGGGAWVYTASAAGTLWRQTNTLILKDRWFARALRPLVVFLLARGTRAAMARAKRQIEDAQRGGV